MLRFGLVLWFLFWSLGIQAQEPKLMLPIGHTGYITSAFFSPDGKQVLTASWDLTAKVWDANTGQLLLDLKGHTSSVKFAIFSPDGKRAITTSSDKTAKIWDTQTGKLLLDLKGHSSIVNSAVFSIDSKRIITVSSDQTAKVWNAQTGQLQLDLKGHIGYFKSAIFSPNEKYILTASSNNTAKMWDANTGQLLLDLKGHTISISSAIFSPDGNSILTASDKTAKIWNSHTGQLLLDLKGHTGDVNCAIFSPDGNRILTASEDETAKVWDVRTGELQLDLKGHTHHVKFAIFSPDGKSILTTSRDTTAKVWDAQTGQLQLDFKGFKSHIGSAIFSPNKKCILMVSQDETAKMWDANTGQLLLDLKGHTMSISSAIFSPDGNSILTASDKTAKIWNSHTGQLLLDLKGHTGDVKSAIFSPDGNRILTASEDETAKVWDVRTGELQLDLKGHTHHVKFAIFSPDGKKLITGDETVKVWDTQTGQLLLDLKDHLHFVNSAVFSIDSKRIITVSSDQTAKVWDAQTGRLQLDLKGHTGDVKSAIFSPNEKYILTASRDNTAKMWDANTGQLLLDLKGHTGYVTSAIFSPDGNSILTTSWDRTAKIWNSHTGQLLLDLKEHKNFIYSTHFSPDRKYILTVSWDAAKIWDANTGQLQLDLKEHTTDIYSAIFSPDGKSVMTATRDNICKLWNAQNGELLCTFMAVDSTDYLVMDKDARYDGTENARKLIYYVCNDKVIELDQFKELGWEPNLVAKIMGVNKDSIKAKGIHELDICGRIPNVEEKGKKKGFYNFQITPGKGGVGDVLVFVNQKLIKNIPARRLSKQGNLYQVAIDENEVTDYFVKGQSNTVSIKAKTADNTLQSRGAEVLSLAQGQAIEIPHLYLVSVGVSKYKGERLNLNFAGKDARDFSGAVAGAARALFNTDGQEHVTVYTLNNESNSQPPFKQDIKQVFETVKAKATPNDIVVVFLAGHGVQPNDSKQFYFLTADASAFDISGVEKEVAVSTAELDEWLRCIKAQKQLLILDACNSGQVLANVQNLIAIRAMPDEQRRALERLKDRTGMFILTASAGSQAAYETSMYGQGLLTYSLLFGMKSGNGLKNNYVDVSNWFNTSADQVRSLAKDIGGRQEPQTIGKASFDVGLVTEAVRNSIVLSGAKRFFTRSKFYIDADLQNDDERIADLTDEALNNLSARGKESPLAFAADHTLPDSYSIRGRYELKGTGLRIIFNLVKGGNVKVQSGELNGTVANKGELVKQMIEQVKGWIK
jgi:WD40 repeat protein